MSFYINHEDNLLALDCNRRILSIIIIIGAQQTTTSAAEASTAASVEALSSSTRCQPNRQQLNTSGTTKPPQTSTSSSRRQQHLFVVGKAIRCSVSVAWKVGRRRRRRMPTSKPSRQPTPNRTTDHVPGRKVPAALRAAGPQPTSGNIKKHSNIIANTQIIAKINNTHQPAFVHRSRNLWSQYYCVYACSILVFVDYSLNCVPHFSQLQNCALSPIYRSLFPHIHIIAL